MFLDFFWFEIKYRLHRISTYVYFAIWFFMTFFAVAARDFGPIGDGKVLLNGPYALTVYCVQLTAFGTVVISAIFGTSILRDFQENTFQLIFTKPISKLAYLGGRWAGSCVICAGIFLGIPLGAAIGSLAPWADHERLGILSLWTLLQPYLTFTLIQIIFLGALFFMVAAFTRRLIVVYLQGVVIFALYLIASIFVIGNRNLETFWPSVFDPIGIVLVSSTTRYWTVVEKNTQLLAWSGALLYNRLLWLSVGLLAIASTLVWFPMSAEALTARRTRKQKKVEEAPEERGDMASAAPRYRPATGLQFGGAMTFRQVLSLTRLRFFNITREIPFWALTIIMIVIALLNAKEAGRMRDTAVWPVTYLMVSVLQSAALFYYVIATLYAGELIWRERDVRFDQIHDALPIPTWANWISQFLSIAAVEFCLLSVVLFCGVGVQAALGYYQFDFAQYFIELYLIAFGGVLAFLMFAFFCQTMVANKFVGHALVIGINLLVPILYRFGVENRLFLFGEIAPYTYSDMNGYGHFKAGLIWSSIYWLAFSVLLGLVSLAFARRGTDLAWHSRLRQARMRLPSLAVPLGVAFVVFAGSGAWFYYNTHVLNPFRTSAMQRKMQAAYERAYKKYELLPQPKITAVDVTADLYPERRGFSAHGTYTLVNRTSAPIRDLHVATTSRMVREMHWSRAAKVKSQDKELGYTIYELDQPLAPGETVNLSFTSGFNPTGFRDAEQHSEIAYNGTFFDRDYFPTIGYDRGAELDNPVRRREEKLPPLEEMPPRGAAAYQNVNLFTPDSEWVTFHAVVSTSPDQIAIAPGYLKREWNQNGRRYFEYDMGDTRINNFFSFLSARYAVKRDRWQNVNLEIYYQPGHEYNLDRMLQSTKRGLDYFQNNFAPYQFTQYRVLEFPRYRSFAQSFPNTVPYSEAIGFIQRVQKPDDIDMVYYVTAHELAHQWWGHQLIGNATQGSNMMSETLAQYSALMVMEQEYGKDNIRKFLRHELDGYLRGRGGETRREPPLALVQREAYVWYNKGSLAMYALRDYIGEQALNAALKDLLTQYRFSQGRLPDTTDFLKAIRAHTPDDMQQVVTDLFENITLFDNKITAATWTQLPDKKYKVALTVESRKLRADGQGVETEVPINDLVDIGVFKGTNRDEKPLHMEKHRITGNKTNLEFTVADQPTRAGIDPYHKLIDRQPDDNEMNVTKQ